MNERVAVMHNALDVVQVFDALGKVSGYRVHCLYRIPVLSLFYVNQSHVNEHPVKRVGMYRLHARLAVCHILDALIEQTVKVFQILDGVVDGFLFHLFSYWFMAWNI
jgi:hypothetical protein